MIDYFGERATVVASIMAEWLYISFGTCEDAQHPSKKPFGRHTTKGVNFYRDALRLVVALSNHQQCGDGKVDKPSQNIVKGGYERAGNYGRINADTMTETRYEHAIERSYSDSAHH